MICCRLTPSRPEDARLTPPDSESRQAFDELLDLLRELSERYAGPEWLVQEADDVGEALRAILHLLEASLKGPQPVARW